MLEIDHYDYVFTQISSLFFSFTLSLNYQTFYNISTKESFFFIIHRILELKVDTE